MEEEIRKAIQYPIKRVDLWRLLLKDTCDGTAVIVPRWCSLNQIDKKYDDVCYAIRSSNVEVLRKLLGSVSPELSERLVSESYEELLLNNVCVSEEMHLFVQYTLLGLRFFSKQSGAFPATPFANNNILERIQMLVDNVAQINTYEEVDRHFLYTARFIAQNIHILKQQLKSTYNILPWEEIEFCLVSFVSAHIQKQELNIFYLSVLKKERLLKELEKFTSALQKLEEDIMSTDVQILRKPRKLDREDVAATIGISYPDLYADYKEVRDISSLHIMKTYLDAALLADSATRLGQLTIKRALQVTGEHLKNTLDSPKLSPVVSELILLSVPKETRKVLRELRNSLSKSHTESSDALLYSNIQNDIKKIASVISDITYFNKVEKIKFLLNTLINSEGVEEFLENANVFQNVHDIVEVQETDITTEDDRKIENLIRNIEDLTPYEMKLFAEIKDILDKTTLQHHLSNNDYSHLKQISEWSSNFNSHGTKPVEKLVEFLKYYAKRILTNFPSQKNSLDSKQSSSLGSLLSKFYNSVSMRIKPEIAFGIEFAIARIFYTGSIDKGNIKSIDEFGRRLILDKFDTNENANEKCKVKKIENCSEIFEKFGQKLAELRNTVGTDRISGKLYEHISLLHKDKTTYRFTVEALVLDIMNILESSQRVPNNILYLDEYIPQLGGRCLRNHLAHGNALADILPTDAWSAVLLNSIKFIEIENLLLNGKIGNILKDDIIQLKRKYERGLSILDKQKEMFKSLLDGNFEDFAVAIAGGADVYSRKEDLSTTLHYAARGPNINIIKFLSKLEMISTVVEDVIGQTALHVAAAFGRDVTVRFLVTEMRNAINQVDGAESTPLHLASKNGHKETVATLLSLGFKKNVTDTMQVSPLFYAVSNNNLDVVKILLRKEVTVDEHISIGGMTSLHIAAEKGHIEMVRYLLLNEADANAKAEHPCNSFPLHLAAANGHLEVVKTLLEKGARVNLQDSNKMSSLHYAVDSGNKEIVKIVLEKGAIVNTRDVVSGTPFHLAVYKGNASIVDLLMQNVANINDTSNDGLSPLLIAAAYGHAEIVDLLLQNGALADSRDVTGATALHYAAKHGHTSVLETLIQRRVDIHTQDRDQETPLHLAARAGHQQEVNMLVAAGADVHSVNIEGYTALHISAGNGHTAISKALIEKGAQVNCKNNFFSPLYIAAAKTCNEDTIQMLLKYGADVNDKGEFNRSVLHYASLAGDSSVVEALLQAGADVDAKDINHTTPLHLAAGGNHKASVEILLKYGADINYLNKDGFSALCWAAKNNNKDLLDILIAKGADVNVGGGQLLISAIEAGHRLVVEALLKNKDVDINIKDHNGSNLLYAAAESGDTLIARELIMRGVKVADCIQDPTPLSIAIAYGHMKFIDFLLENGANINPADPNVSPLYYAVRANKPDMMEKLLRWGANSNIRNSKNRTPLELAVSNAQIQNTSILLQQNDVRINERSNDNQTLLHIAAEGGNIDITRLLVNRGADKDAKNIHGFKPIHVAATRGHKNILAFFLEHGMSIDDRNSGGFTLLHLAAAAGQLDLAQYLLGKQVDIHAIEFSGFMPIHCAALGGHTEMVKLLLHSGAVYDSTDIIGRTLLDMTKSQDIKDVLDSIGKLFKAVKRNDVLMVRYLVKDSEKYVNVRRSDKTTMLHVASWRGFQEVCDILLESKANPDAVGKGGTAPLHYASKYSHPGIVESLLKNGAIYNPKSDNFKTPLDYAKQADIKSLLELVSRCFQKVGSHDVTVIKDINTEKNVEIIKAVMRARDTNGNTLVVVAMKNNFPGINELKAVSQPNFCHNSKKVALLFESESFTEGLETLNLLLSERIKILGEDNPGTLDCRFKIVDILVHQSKFSEAMYMLEEIYRKRVEAFGPHHPDSLSTRSKMALALNHLGRSEEAWDIFQEVMPRQQEILGDEHLELMLTKTNAGSVLVDLKKYEEALVLETEVYKVSLKKNGVLHHHTLVIQNNIARALRCQGKHQEASAMYQYLYKVNKILLGLNHSDTLNARRNMAIILTLQNKFDEALPILQETLAIQTNVLGLYHEDTIHTQYLITELHISQNNLPEALKVHKTGLEARNSTLGPNHPAFAELDKLMHNFEKQLLLKLNERICCFHPSDVQLLKAVSEGDREEVCKLIQNGSDVNTVDGEGRTPLHFATTVEVMKLLLDGGADATAVSQKGNTPLHLATSRACGQTVRLLLQNVKKTKHSKFINAKTAVGGSTALHVAAKKGATDIVRCLLEHGACYNSRDRSDNRTPLQCSSSSSVTQLLRLAEEVFEVAKRGGTVLPEGEERHLAAVMNSRNTENRTPLQLAIFNGHATTARVFAELLKSSNQSTEGQANKHN